MNRPLTRRAFLRDGTLVLAAAGGSLANAAEAPAVRFGLVTDLHYADKPPAGTRHYRETLDKLAEAGQQFAKDKPAFVVELGDLIDSADSIETELSYLRTINKAFAAIAKNRHHVLGNHCVDRLSKAEFLGGIERKDAHYSFDSSGTHFIVLDACYRSDGKHYGRKNSKWNDANIPDAELDWLKADLKAAKGKTIVFVHQRLDVTNDYRVRNAPAVRKLLEESGKVLAVFQGHSHKNDHKEIAGIHYCTLTAMIEGQGAENNGYTTADVASNGTIVVSGFRKQQGYEWKKA